MAYALVVSTKATPGGDGGDTGAIDTTGANLLILVASSFSAISSVSDSKGNTWVPLTDQSESGTRHARIWYAANPNVGSGHTFTVTGTSAFPWIGVAAFSGGATVSPFDQENGSTSPSAISLAPGSVTPTEDDELIVTAVCGIGDATPSLDSGFTVAQSDAFASGAAMQGGLGYLIQTTATAANPTWTLGGPNSCAATIATFRAASGGGGLVIPVAVAHYRQQGMM